ncbi:MAG: substrate-binding periplasmic protein [Sphingomonadaceae bacterium]
MPTLRATLSCALLPAMLLAAGPLRAADFACPALIRVGISDLGYSSYRDGDQYRGTSVDVVAELGRRTGCTFRIDWYPRGRLFVEFANGKLDMAMAALRDPARDRVANWIPYTYTQFELLLSKASSGQFRSLAEFVDGSQARLNLTRGVSYTPATQVQLERLQQQGRLEYVNDYEAVFRKIKAGRADGTLAPPVIHLLHTRRSGLGGKLVATPISEWPRKLIGAYVSNQNLTPELQRGLGRVMYDLVADGSVQRIYARYVGTEIAQQQFAGGVSDILDAIPR